MESTGSVECSSCRTLYCSLSSMPAILQIRLCRPNNGSSQLFPDRPLIFRASWGRSVWIRQLVSIALTFHETLEWPEHEREDLQQKWQTMRPGFVGRSSWRKPASLPQQLLSSKLAQTHWALISVFLPAIVVGISELIQRLGQKSTQSHKRTMVESELWVNRVSRVSRAIWSWSSLLMVHNPKYVAARLSSHHLNRCHTACVHVSLCHKQSKHIMKYLCRSFYKAGLNGETAADDTRCIAKGFVVFFV